MKELAGLTANTRRRKPRLSLGSQNLRSEAPIDHDSKEVGSDGVPASLSWNLVLGSSFGFKNDGKLVKEAFDC